ncbi:hypothetical protein Ae168Ps1_6418c [Pseudonocardia sp. Ae168_Ps1]|nr:hypothetical protein Ae168Ps1_6418c [Pseudonocardia sp. Ae168_Ps1]OLL69993.1 hypothetical protein Ae263Ps1_6385c [Pseudonocardia sp. Ae263_Ps1]OLL89015.1 hypothetical protein Ae356Ps1_6342 [Pseudonocardia sp. Ae356_Ps1]OLM08405.1 hypothetical protein Ae505Ps2_6111 [Pseudonocardia sp. Ae505_Ps2]OLM08413.1 hypothetical protein Ae505Ps2_6119 [Pseudonocardia sp. Ae505_Ps2]
MVMTRMAIYVGGPLDGEQVSAARRQRSANN